MRPLIPSPPTMVFHHNHPLIQPHGEPNSFRLQEHQQCPNNRQIDLFLDSQHDSRLQHHQVPTAAAIPHGPCYRQYQNAIRPTAPLSLAAAMSMTMTMTVSNRSKFSIESLLAPQLLGAAAHHQGVVSPGPPLSVGAAVDGREAGDFQQHHRLHHHQQNLFQTKQVQQRRIRYQERRRIRNENRPITAGCE